MCTDGTKQEKRQDRNLLMCFTVEYISCRHEILRGRPMVQPRELVWLEDALRIASAEGSTLCKKICHLSPSCRTHGLRRSGCPTSTTHPLRGSVAEASSSSFGATSIPLDAFDDCLTWPSLTGVATTPTSTSRHIRQHGHQRRQQLC